MKISEFFITEQENPNYKKLFRDWRYLELSQSDWTQLPNAPVNQNTWAEYRQALRDLPSIVDFENAELPEKP